MRGFCHWAGWEPERNVDCGVLEFDKTECCLSDSQLTALYLRPDHIQTPSASMSPPLFFKMQFEFFSSLEVTVSQTCFVQSLKRQFTSIFFSQIRPLFIVFIAVVQPS